MHSPEDYPRVLFITSHAFNHETGGGVTFSNLFWGWPKDRLACVHNDPLPVTHDVCERYYRLRPDDIGKWGVFGRALGPVRRSKMREAAVAKADGTAETTDIAWSGSRFLVGVRNACFGRDEFPETARLSQSLKDWIADFKPDLIYTILGNNAFLDLVGLIRNAFDLPLAVHFMDDWKADAYAKGVFSPPRRRAMHAKLVRLIDIANLRMGISDAMCNGYGDEFGVPFIPFQNAVDPSVWPAVAPRARQADDDFVLLYSGAVLPFAQLTSLAEICTAVENLRQEGVRVRLDIHAPPAMTDPYRERLLTGPSVRLSEPFAEHSDYLRAIRQADTLLLPVNFDDRSQRFIHYSMPTKVPEFLFSGVPILVYGPASAAQVSYAHSRNWGLVVTTRGVEYIMQAIRRLVAEPGLRETLLRTALHIARDQHDALAIRRRFQSAMAMAISGSEEKSH